MILENVINLLEETKTFIHDNKGYVKLQEALDIILAIKQGNIDAVFMVNNETAKVLVSKTADETYRKFIESMSHGVTTLLDDGTILYCNQSFSHMVKIPIEKVIGSNIRNYIPSVYIETFERIFDGAPLEMGNLNICVNGPELINSYYTVSIHKLSLEDFIAINLVWTDITELTETKEHLIIANQKLLSALNELRREKVSQDIKID